MLPTIVEFANLLLAALLAGAMFGVWLSFNPAGLAAQSYVAHQQHAIRTLNMPMPILGGATALLTLASAAFAWGDSTRLSLLLIAAACFIGAGLITRFLNQPINAVVMTWSVDNTPEDWTRLRDEWWQWHVFRTVIGIGGLCLLIIATLKH